MTSRNRDVRVTMVRIQWFDRKDPITYRNNVTISIPKDADTNVAYIRISVDQQMMLSEELSHYQWISRSSTDGVVTIGTSTANIIIIYDVKDRESTNLIAELRAVLQKDQSPGRTIISSPQSQHAPDQRREDQIQAATNELLQFIEEGSVLDVERVAKYLAESHAKVQFKLVTHQDNVPSKAEASASDDTLQLKIRIECHLNREPLEVTIFVRPGTKLYALKDEIQSKTGIDRRDQFWYAFNRYMIADEYVFGSEDKVTPPRLKNNVGKQMVRSDAPVRSGDTLVLYVARLPPFE